MLVIEKKESNSSTLLGYQGNLAEKKDEKKSPEKFIKALAVKPTKENTKKSFTSFVFGN